MAGYQPDFSMSNNARDAYEEGRVPASKILGIPTALIKKFVPTKEWHHTSKNYNKTEFYNPHHVRVIFGLEQHTPSCGEDCEGVVHNLEAEEALRAPKKEQLTIIHPTSTVKWVDFSKGRRGRTIATPREVEGAYVEEKGNWAHITLPNGTTMKKKINGNYFSFSKNTNLSNQFNFPQSTD